MKHLFQLSLLMLAFLLPTTALAHDFEVDGIYYNINGNEASVTYRGSNPSMYDEYTSDVTIPSSVTYGGTIYPVTAIGSSAFHGCNGLTSIDIPNSVTTIGSSAFSYSRGLTSITLPNSVTSIGGYAFDGTPWYNNQPDGLVYAGLVAYNYKGTMPSATSIIIRDGTLGIADYAFSGCSGLTSINIPNTVKTIGDYAFSRCSGLTSITIPNSVTTIGGSAFSGCSGLTNIDIPNSVIYIGSGAFSSTVWYNNQPDGLVYAGLVAYKYKGTMPSSTSIIIRYGTRSITDHAFSGCSGLTSVTIPNSVTSIGNGAFSDCSGLTSIDIPNSVTTIGGSAFSGCSGLTSITVASGNPTYDSRNNFNAIIETTSNTLILGCKNTVIPNSVTSIGNGAFSGCSGLTSIDIPNSVTSIGGSAFYGCSGLTSINIPNSVISIGSGAFSGTAWYVNQPDGVVYAGLVAIRFKGISPEDGCISLKDGTLGIADYAFDETYGNDWMTNIILPNSLVHIGNHAFDYCYALNSIVIPNNVTTIGEGAFSGCYYLGSVTIGKSLVNIDLALFSDCLLGEIIVDSENPVYDSRDNCNAIIETATNSLIMGSSNTIIPNTVTSISDGAMVGSKSSYNTVYLSIPNSVTYIGHNAFCFIYVIYCMSLQPPKIFSNSFVYCNENDCLSTLHVPDISLESYQSANYWKNFDIVGMPYTFEVDGKSYHATTMSTVSVIANNDEGILYSGDVVIPDSVTYEGYTFAVTGIEGNAFDGCYELTSVVIPNTVESISEQAFQGCTGLTSVTIGSGVTAIGAKAFNYCNALETVKCLGTVPPVMASADCFTNTAYNRVTLLVPRNTEATYTAADYWYKFAHIDGWGSAGQGDVNGDGVMSITDVTSLIDVLLGNEMESFYFESADLNNNGRIDIGDVTTLIDNLLNGDY